MRHPAALSLIAFSAYAAASPSFAMAQYTGEAFARGSDTLIYREVHIEDASRHAIVFQCPDGRAFARKRLSTAGAPTQPDFDFKDARNGYEEGVRGEGGQRVAYVRKVDGQRSEHPLSIDAGAVIDAGFDAYVRANWDRVIQGGASVPFLMTGRGKFFPVKITAAPAQGPDRRIDLRLDAWYGFAAPTISVTYTEATRLLRRYEGPGAIRDEHGKPLDVRIEFSPSERKSDVPSHAWDDALALPLDGRCPA
ncbi:MULTISPECIES: hypothetical protein [Luteibacter]|uniref:hypothetical protein n=1 Tax=Luteibacter TaxID=242605 RepID=UPI0006896807|nr:MULTISPECIES: hypothetical protein [unclassified Luteibacter]